MDLPLKWETRRYRCVTQELLDEGTVDNGTTVHFLLVERSDRKHTHSRAPTVSGLGTMDT